MDCIRRWVVDDDRSQRKWTFDEDQRQIRWAVNEDRRRRRREADNDRRRRRWVVDDAEDDYPPLQLPLQWRDPPPLYLSDDDRRRQFLRVAQIEASLNLRDALFADFNRSLERRCTSALKLSSKIYPRSPESSPLRPHSVTHSSTATFSYDPIPLPQAPPEPMDSLRSHDLSLPQSPPCSTFMRHSQSNRSPPLSQTIVIPPKSSPISPTRTELLLPLPPCSRNLGSGVESELLQTTSASSRDQPADLLALQAGAPNLHASLYAPVIDAFHHPTLLSLLDPAASVDVHMDDGFAPQTPVQPVNPFFRARALKFSFPHAPASAQISRSNPPACPESSITACSDSVDSESTSNQIRPHVVPVLVAHSVPFPLLRAPFEPVNPPSVGDLVPMLKTVSNFDKSEMDKLLGVRRGKAVADVAVCAGLQFVPVTFSNSEKANQTLQVGNVEIMIHGPSERENVLCFIFNEYPNVIVVDDTFSDAVNGNAEFYCKLGMSFVMATTGGDMELLYKIVRDANVNAVISPHMGKQVFSFLAAMELMAEQFPGAFSGYSLQVMESHQAGKRDTSGTAKAVISCFMKLGVSFDVNKIKMIRDPKKQLEMVGVLEEHLEGHAFHMYHLTSPDETVSLEFQHNVYGRSIYAEGTIDAAIFLSKKIKSKVLDILDILKHLSSRRMNFEEFCADAICPYQLEALEGWEQMAMKASEYFEQEGNRVITVEELADDMNLASDNVTLRYFYYIVISTDGGLQICGNPNELNRLMNKLADRYKRRRIFDPGICFPLIT